MNNQTDFTLNTIETLHRRRKIGIHPTIKISVWKIKHQEVREMILRIYILLYSRARSAGTTLSARSLTSINTIACNGSSIHIV